MPFCLFVCFTLCGTLYKLFTKSPPDFPYYVNSRLGLLGCTFVLQTGNALAFFLYNLANNPDKQSLLLDEIDREIPRGCEITAERLQRMQYLRAALRESFRYVCHKNIRYLVLRLSLTSYPAMTNLIYTNSEFFPYTKYVSVALRQHCPSIYYLYCCGPLYLVYTWRLCLLQPPFSGVRGFWEGHASRHGFQRLPSAERGELACNRQHTVSSIYNETVHYFLSNRSTFKHPQCGIYSVYIIIFSDW